MFLPPEVWAILMFSGQMLDALTTRIALTKYGGRELNPIGRFLIDRWGFKGLQVAKASAAWFLAVMAFSQDSEILWSLAASVSFFPVGWNAIMLWRASREPS